MQAAVGGRSRRGASESRVGAHVLPRALGGGWAHRRHPGAAGPVRFPRRRRHPQGSSSPRTTTPRPDSWARPGFPPTGPRGREQPPRAPHPSLGFPGCRVGAAAAASGALGGLRGAANAGRRFPAAPTGTVRLLPLVPAPDAPRLATAAGRPRAHPRWLCGRPRLGWPLPPRPTARSPGALSYLAETLVKCM